MFERTGLVEKPVASTFSKTLTLVMPLATAVEAPKLTNVDWTSSEDTEEKKSDISIVKAARAFKWANAFV
ncbi:hypothetical protein GCM10011359_13150 [Nesterenkonia alkaliphila]|nr:hypothetical protein GCM10011359_13150 [Nesterenkonia alkaliphila]